MTTDPPSLPTLVERACPVCGAHTDNSNLFLEQSFDPTRLNAYSFASRKTPEFMSFRFVTCRNCATVYASPAPSPDAIKAAYQVAEYDSNEEAELAAATYGEAVAPHLAKLASRLDALEIGTGTGAFLSVLQGLGFKRVLGIEPSRKAIEAATPAIRSCIREGIFSADAFEPESFDLVCCFMTLEHVSAPLALVTGARRLLRPGGLLALVTHDYGAPVNRLLGRKSPIIDIEHLQIFCPQSLERLVSAAGLVSQGVHSYPNRYPLKYWLRLSPIPGILKSTIDAALARVGLDRVLLRFNVGNVLTLAQKPLSASAR